MQEISNVTVSIHKKAPPPSELIKVEDVIVSGAGTLNETIFGGELTVAVDLTQGKEEKALNAGESVFVRGHLQGGGTFMFPFALQATETHKPWKFGGKSGVKGP